MAFKLTELKDEMERRVEARARLIPFVEYTKPDYEAARHHRFLAEYLEAVERGELKRLIINTPPRHGKSELVTRRFAAWFLGRQPDKFVITGSYNADLATDFGRDVRYIVNSPEYRALFPKVELRQDSRAADRWNTTLGGAYFAAGVGSGITGRGMHLGILDDPFKGQEEADSPVYKEKLWKWWKTDFKTRMMPDAAIVIVKTRWAKDGLVGRILDTEGSKWTIINLPGFAVDPDPLGRAPGEPLWPEWYSAEALREMEEGMTLREWSALYQGAPIPEGGNLFKSEWFKTYKELPPIESLILALDTAWETQDTSSYSVILAIGVGPDGYYLIGFWRGKVEYPELKKQLEVQALKWHPLAIVVEKKSSGVALVQEMNRTSRWPVIPVTASKEAVVRARATTPLFESGRVLFPELAVWRDTVEAELCEFPGGRYDDIVAALVHGLTYLHENFTFIGYSEPVMPVMSWDPYSHRHQDDLQVTRHWDVYRRVH